jgi:hypothetical protein
MRLPAAADWVGFGTTKFLEMVADGRMPPGGENSGPPRLKIQAERRPRAKSALVGFGR